MSRFPNAQDSDRGISRNVVKMPSILGPEDATKFNDESQSWLLLPVDVHVLDMGEVLAIDPAMYPAISAFGKLLKQNDKRLQSINVSKVLLDKLASAGLKDLFGVVQAEPPPKSQVAIDVRLINPFLKAVIDVFGTQVQTKLAPQKPFIQNQSTTLDIGIVGIVGLNCSQFKGNIALCFPTDVFLKIYERMLGETHKEITPEIADLVAELLNIIYGQAKTDLNAGLGLDLPPALPTVLRGEKLSLRQNASAPVVVLPFQSDLGIFHVEIATMPTESKIQRSA